MKLKIMFFISLAAPVCSQGSNTMQLSNQKPLTFWQGVQLKSPRLSSVLNTPKASTWWLTIQPGSFFSSINKKLLEHKKLLWGAGLLAATSTIAYLSWRGFSSYSIPLESPISEPKEKKEQELGKIFQALDEEQKQNEAKIKNALKDQSLIEYLHQKYDTFYANYYKRKPNMSLKELNQILEEQQQILKMLKSASQNMQVNTINRDFAGCLEYAATKEAQQDLVAILEGFSKDKQIENFYSFKECLQHTIKTPSLQKRLIAILEGLPRMQQTHIIGTHFSDDLQQTSATPDLQERLIAILEHLLQEEQAAVISWHFSNCLQHTIKTPSLQKRLIAILEKFSKEQYNDSINGHFKDCLQYTLEAPNLQHRLGDIWRKQSDKE